jgi:hypothetical protein
MKRVKDKRKEIDTNTELEMITPLLWKLHEYKIDADERRMLDALL